MKIEDLPKWMSLIPTLIGVGLAIAGMYVFPMYGLRNTLGPMIGLPIAMPPATGRQSDGERRGRGYEDDNFRNGGPGDPAGVVAGSFSIDDEPPLADGEVRLCQLSLEEQQRFAMEGPEGLEDFWLANR